MLPNSTETKEDTDHMVEFMRKNKHRLVDNIGGAPLKSYSWNYQSRVTSPSVPGPPLSWADQAAQNPWSSSNGTRNSRWIVKTDSVSSTHKEDNPFQGPSLPHKTFGQPKLTLGNWYSKRYQILLPNESFECRNNGDAPHLLKWTCTFTCPLTANSFASGQYVGADRTRFSTSMDGDDCLIVWFHTKKEAEHAAAARALDCLNFMEKERFKGQSSVEYYNYCLERPEIPSIPYPTQTQQTSGSRTDEEKFLTHDSTNTNMADVDHELSDLTISASVLIPTKKHLHFTPKQQLVQWYASRYKVTLQKDAFVCRNNANPKQHFLKWTCAFTCPLTKNAFKSGRLRMNKYSDESEEEPMMEDDDVWFSSKKEAEHAAAARALDCLEFMNRQLENTRDPNEKNIDEYHYYCQEKPTIPPIPYPQSVALSGGRMVENEFKESLDCYRMARIDG